MIILFACYKIINVTLEKVEEKYVLNNFQRVFADKNSHLILNTCESISINIDNEVIKRSSDEKLLGINSNNRLGFDTHVTSICNLLSKKLHALARISEFMSI